MTAQAGDPGEWLRQLIADGRASLDALSRMTGIEPDRLRAFIEDARPPGMSRTPPLLSSDESARVSTLAAYLSEGMQIDDDERLKAIFESLTSECGLTLHNLAQLTGVEVDAVDVVLGDPASLPPATKYALAVRGSHILNAANQARRQ